MEAGTITSQLQALTKHFLPNLSEDTYNTYQSYFFRILSSRTKTPIETEQQLIGLMCKRTTKESRFRILFDKILNSKAISKKRDILYCLYCLSKEPSLSSEETYKFNTLFKAPQPMIIDSVLDNEEKPSLFMNISEDDILFDLLNVFKGMEGEYIKYSDNSYHIIENVAIASSAKQLVLELCELGWLYKQVVAYIQLNEPTSGQTVKYFCSAIKDELNEYMHLLETLEAQLRGDSKESSQRKLNLIRLRLWVQDPMERMKWLSIICSTVKSRLVTKYIDLKGGALASTIKQHIGEVPGMVSSFLSKLLEGTCEPLLRMIEQWMINGDAQDLYGDFFIEENQKVIEDKLWTDKYSLNVEQAPAFLTYDQAYKIFLTGKAINFIRKCCKEEWTIPSSLQEPGIKSWNQIVSNPGAIDEWILKIYEATNSQLVTLLFTKYCLLDHYESIRRYLLLGQGELHRYLMDLIYDHLSRPAEQVYK